MSPRLLRAVGRGWLAVLGLLTVAVFVLVLIPAKDAVVPTRFKYGLVFDAGSTHTSLYIYRWPADKENGTGIVSQVEACYVSGPGISSYADNPAGAGASLKPCLDRAMKIVPAEQQRETPTYLGATAGMRLLRMENSTKAEQVFAEVSKAIGEYPVDFRGARILTGSEEGSFGWITVNYLLETLVKFSFAERWEHPQDTEVLGALDLGGASTQITFQPGVPVEDRNTSVFFRLYGTNYSLYSHSYLCYGQSQALKMLLAALHQASSSAQISHPCYPRGYQENITVAELYDSPCAFSGFYHTLHFLNLTGGQSLSSVNATIAQICSSSWEQLQLLFPTASRTQLRDACTASSYSLTLLLQGYKFSHTTWPSIHFVQQVANTDVGWTLGYMLNLTNMIPSEPPAAVTGLPSCSWIAATVLLAIMLILTFCLLAATCCQKNSSGYEHL
ncbi:ectonucleoside triphosphate diphosphohydrolase 8-like isoform X2 [Corvus moneduloides]|uniref:ectonucleoside triphosphate diphosphohydrolase 8-like isoform X2 n=1 Tax=Corvus moneduloides TaxID=1196302 RepID=UPI0013642012|nr:ectonucleoside triphosphate diphosphohydrolase 8-like isoform X2 [Corvus moneduloides]